jgi:hypothetical protein
MVVYNFIPGKQIVIKIAWFSTITFSRKGINFVSYLFDAQTRKWIQNLELKISYWLVKSIMVVPNTIKASSWNIFYQSRPTSPSKLMVILSMEPFKAFSKYNPSNGYKCLCPKPPFDS